MKTRIFLVAMALMVFASLSFGQGFCAFMYGNAPTVNCDGTGGPIPEGTTIYIYWDQNGNGPDASDPLACTAPPPCSVNHCVETMGAGGYWETYLDFCSPGCMPSPAAFYLVIYCPGTTIRHWWTDAFTFASGPQDHEWVFTHCDPQACAAACNPTIEVAINAPCAPGVPQCRQSVCLDLCTGHVTIVRVFGVLPLDPAHMPISSWIPGCEPIVTECDRVCTPAIDAIVEGPFPDPASGSWYYMITGGSVEGCLCFTFQYWLAANFNNDFVPVAMDNSVKLTWSTASETGLLRYDIVRGTEVVGNVPATNGSSRSEYTFVDHSAVNGTTYSYTLRSVGVNNDATDLATVEGVTPSFNAAVITEYALHQNFPNPFNPTTEIAFDVLNSNPVTLKIYNAAGQEVASLLNGATREGGKRYVVNFDATNLTSGLYFYTVKIGSEFSATKKMLLIK